MKLRSLINSLEFLSQQYGDNIEVINHDDYCYNEDIFFRYIDEQEIKEDFLEKGRPELSKPFILLT